MNIRIWSAAELVWFLLAMPGSAQWLRYPTAGVPRLANGQANLAASAPRTAGGQPDFSGLWEPARNRPCPPACEDNQITREFINIASSLESGLPYQPWAAQTVKQRVADLRKDDPVSRCLPAGIVRSHATPTYRKFIQVPGLLVELNEYNGSYRQIFTDGRPLPVDPNPSWNGYSTGRWDGDTLLVESIGFRDVWLDATGNPLTDSAKIVERWRRPNYGSVEVDVTVDDPKAYTKPWTVTLRFSRVLDTELLDFMCIENEKDVKHLVGR